jgi:hypothetical protein
VASFGPPIVPIKVKQGLIVVQNIDWSIAPVNPITYDFSTQPNQNKLEYVNGMWVDNSGNTNDVIIYVQFTSQSLRVFAGEVATFPVFGTQMPRIQIINAQNGTPNVGQTNVIFLDWDIGFAIAQTAGGSVVIVQDTTFTTANKGGFVRGAWSQAAITIINPTIAPGNQVVAWVGGVLTQWFSIQNTPASAGNLLVRFAALGTPPSIADSFQVLPGNRMNCNDFGPSLLTGKCSLGAVGGSVTAVIASA